VYTNPLFLCLQFPYFYGQYTLQDIAAECVKKWFGREVGLKNKKP